MSKFNLEEFEEETNVYIKTIYGDEFICNTSVFIDGEDNYEENGDYGINELALEIIKIIKTNTFIKSGDNLIRENQIMQINKI